MKRLFVTLPTYVLGVVLSTGAGAEPTFDYGSGFTVVEGDDLSWSDVDVGSQYWVYVGTVSGGRDVLDSGSLGNQMSIEVGEWPEQVYIRLWYRPNGEGWKSVFERYAVASCPAPVKEQYDEVDSILGPYVGDGNDELFDGTLCFKTYAIGDPDYEYRFGVLTGGESEPDIRPATVFAKGQSLWVTKAEARACANYIDC